MLAATPGALGLDVPRLETYYRQVGDWILPYLVDRPLGLLRSLGEFELPFFQKLAKAGTPEVLTRIPVLGRGIIAEHFAVSDRAGLLALPSIEVIEIHAWGSTREHLDRPDRLVFDLDPGPDVAWKEIVEGAELVKDALAREALASFPMITGSRGVHLICPLMPRADWRRAREFAKGIVERLVAGYPSRFVGDPSMTERAGRIFIDHLRNDYGATSIVPYSTRARSGAHVAAPLTWDELERSSGPAIYDVVSMPARLATIGRDPWDEFWKVRQAL